MTENSDDPAYQRLPPPRHNISHVTMGESSFGVLAPVTDSRSYHYTIHNNTCGPLGGKGPFPNEGDVPDRSSCNPSPHLATEYANASPCAELATSPSPTHQTSAKDFCPKLNYADETARIPMSPEQGQNIKDVASHIFRFYELACRWIDHLNSPKLQHVSEDAQRQRAIFLVELQALCDASIDDNQSHGTGAVYSVDTTSPVEQLQVELRSIHSKVINVLEKLTDCGEPPSIIHGSRRRASHFKTFILPDLRRIIQVLEDGNSIKNIQGLCLTINPLYSTDADVQTVLRKRSILTKASISLLQSLGTTCSAHGDHRVWLSLDAEGLDETVLKRAFFHIAFECPDDPDTTTSFRVESTFKEPETEPDCIPKARRRSTRLRLKDTTLAGVKPTRVTKSPSTPPGAGRQENLIRQVEREFCLARYRQRDGVEWTYKLAARFLTPIGNHEIFYPNSDRVLKEPIPLRTLVSRYKTTHDTRVLSAFDPTQRRRIGTSILRAFLQFGSANWLRKIWDMDHIFVYNMSMDAERVQYEPIVKTLVPRQMEGQSDLTTAERREMRITLGAMLIEVALAERYMENYLRHMRSQEDHFREYCRRTGKLGRLVAREVGSVYAGLVEDCVNAGCRGDFQDADDDNFNGEILKKIYQLENAQSKRSES
ncbi:hypothetical protein BHE90_011059 [Fusarium euwallaceae]|uniref:DUF7580 domain-containing protein n=1 Tax=Fusarium euwallaceae TaxID=1147111 RepID=A0A430LFJ8_9HYPO|nr:hypothetical protein BHE90_011059 [Fusarium euwallaceae]